MKGTDWGHLNSCGVPLVRHHDLAILDLDGVVYVGPQAVPGAARAIEAASREGLRCCYLTNNASRPPTAVAEQLRDLGISATANDIVNSAQVAAQLLAKELETGAKVFVNGGAGLHEAIREVGLHPVSAPQLSWRSADGYAPDETWLEPVGNQTGDQRDIAVLQPNFAWDAIVAVAQGYNPQLTWLDLAATVCAVRDGLLWMATNLDLTIPTDTGIKPGNGNRVNLVARAARRRPDRVAGKPQPAPFQQAAQRFHASRPIVVGDRLDTDIAGGRAAGMPTMLVLTGVHGARDAALAPSMQRPTYLAADLGGLLQPQPEVAVHVESGRLLAVCRDAQAWVDTEPLPRLQVRRGEKAAAAIEVTTGVQGSPDANSGAHPDGGMHLDSDLDLDRDAYLDVARAACAAAWAWADQCAETSATDTNLATPALNLDQLLERRATR